MGDVSLTPLGITVLGLLSERSMHPYEMYQLASVRRGDQLVKIKPGSLYHTVSRLEKQELLASIGTDREGNRPERTTYEITARGREALEHQLREMLAVPVREYPRLPLALAEMHNLSASTACQMLRIRLAHLDKTIAKFEVDYEAVKAAEKTTNLHGGRGLRPRTDRRRKRLDRRVGDRHRERRNALALTRTSRPAGRLRRLVRTT